MWLCSTASSPDGSSGSVVWWSGFRLSRRRGSGRAPVTICLREKDTLRRHAAGAVSGTVLNDIMYIIGQEAISVFPLWVPPGVGGCVVGLAPIPGPGP